jgi:hypothetical protein
VAQNEKLVNARKNKTVVAKRMGVCPCVECNTPGRPEPTRPNKYWPENYYAIAYAPMVKNMKEEYNIKLTPYQAACLADWVSEFRFSLSKGE